MSWTWGGQTCPDPEDDEEDAGDESLVDVDRLPRRGRRKRLLEVTQRVRAHRH